MPNAALQDDSAPADAASGQAYYISPSNRGSEVKVWVVVLKIFGYAWVVVGVIAIAIGIAGVWMKGGFSAVQDLMSPFNILNWVVMAITLGPGLGALAWAKSLAERQTNLRS